MKKRYPISAIMVMAVAVGFGRAWLPGGLERMAVRAQTELPANTKLTNRPVTVRVLIPAGMSSRYDLGRVDIYAQRYGSEEWTLMASETEEIVPGGEMTTEINMVDGAVWRVGAQIVDPAGNESEMASLHYTGEETELYLEWDTMPPSKPDVLLMSMIDVNNDGRVDAVDIQMTINGVLGIA